MKNLIITAAIASLFLSASFKPAAPRKQIVLMGAAVVELFTSEGCSSCPPADEALARLAKEYAGKPVYLLSFHVDYWDKLGWKDPYSNPDYTDRQKAYAKQLNAQAYTPQAIVNGKKELIGSQSGTLHNLINASLKIMPENAISVGASFQNLALTATYKLHSVDDNDLVNVALVQDHATDRISAGENKGATLSHINVVRVFKTVKSKQSGEIKLDIPKDLSGKPFKLILYVQNKNDLHITAANTMSLSPTRVITVSKSK
ncbi:DUF1223 domain-containing protein [Mucilaginibacter sp. KACC 22063]|uniref:DUF1223 domain-containing protein n=1 Tax=Mucilaginibacter sp. KACC 22063 TaxID=3025666 RepID=UPI0023657E1D|nr:DUF1223 domain-containing protein [Mucilaginibacter sp. KACC 22063]WDF54260.1 DUF1223 domain-containing protein [Mucilaginibacter sp. KACC 22063]